MRLIAMIMIMLFVSGCAPAMSRSPTAQSSQITTNNLVGVWYFTDSTAKIKISTQGSQIAIDGWDSFDGEKFIITDIHFDGKNLGFTTLMPSTNWLVHNECLVISDKEMQLSRSGASSQSSRMFKE